MATVGTQITQEDAPPLMLLPQVQPKPQAAPAPKVVRIVDMHVPRGHARNGYMYYGCSVACWRAYRQRPCVAGVPSGAPRGSSLRVYLVPSGGVQP